MHIEKDCIIIFDDKEEIPLQIEIQDTINRQYLPQPLAINKVGLTELISQNQQIQLGKKINEMRRLIEMAGEPLQQTLRLNQNNGNNILPDFVFGPRPLETNVGEYGFRNQFCREQNQANQNQQQNNQNNQYNLESNVSILIYKGETYNSLIEQLNQYNNVDTKIKPIVLINGKTAFKNLMRSNEALFLDFFVQKYLPFQQKFMTSNHHSLYFQIQGQIGYYFVFARELNKLELIKWIYLGILKFIQPKFVVITSSNECYLDNINILQLFSILEQEQKYFGIQSLKKISYEGSYFGDLIEIALNLDSMFKIKQFHDPLSCIYMWERIESFVEKYLNQLIQQQFSHSWAAGYNAILPKLMQEDANKELKIITQQISEQKFQKNQFETVFNQFCELNQNINYQLRKCRYSYCKNVFQWFISKLLFIYNYFSISVCFFFSFQCPYQIIYYIFEQNVGYTALAVILPIFYSINVLLFLLLTQLYHFKDKIIEKDEHQEIALMGIRNDQEQTINFRSYVKSSKVDVLQSQRQAPEDQINLEVQEDELTKSATYSMNNSLLKEQELFFQYKFPKLKYMSAYFNYLITIQNYLDFVIVLFIIANLIIIHGKLALNQQSLYEMILIIMAFFVIFFHLINIRCREFKLIFKFSFLSYFWQFFQLPKNTTSATQRINQKKKLGTQLLLNGILFYTFISFESYYNYSGYILIGILAYLSIIYLIVGLFSFIKNICYYNSIPERRSQIQEVKLREGINLNIENDIQNALVENARILVGCTVRRSNDNNIINLANNIRHQVNEDSQLQDLNQNQKNYINQIIKQAVQNHQQQPSDKNLFLESNKNIVSNIQQNQNPSS